jgi:hypothetical protein
VGSWSFAAPLAAWVVALGTLGVTDNLLLPLRRATHPFTVAFAPNWQLLFTTVLVVLVLAEALLRWRRLSSLDRLLAVYTFVRGSRRSPRPRVGVGSEAALVPAAIMVGRLSRAVALIAGALAVVIAVSIGHLFFAGGLV